MSLPKEVYAYSYPVISGSVILLDKEKTSVTSKDTLRDASSGPLVLVLVIGK